MSPHGPLGSERGINGTEEVDPPQCDLVSLMTGKLSSLRESNRVSKHVVYKYLGDGDTFRDKAHDLYVVFFFF